MTIKVLFVCLGNICRSPAAEGVFKHIVSINGLEGRIHVDSAGTGGWHVGEMADTRMRTAAAKRGFKLNSIGRQITKGDFKNFHYIIAMDENNYADCLALRPANVVAQINRMKDYIHSHSISGIPDPYYGGEQGFEEVLDLLEEGCLNLLNEIQRINEVNGE